MCSVFTPSSLSLSLLVFRSQDRLQVAGMAQYCYVIHVYVLVVLIILIIMQFVYDNHRNVACII